MRSVWEESFGTAVWRAVVATGAPLSVAVEVRVAAGVPAAVVVVEAVAVVPEGAAVRRVAGAAEPAR